MKIFFSIGFRNETINKSLTRSCHGNHALFQLRNLPCEQHVNTKGGLHEH